MSLNQLNKLLKDKKINFLFSDYYDTIVHREVHPNYVQRIWAKFVIREMGLSTSIDNLYFIRQASSRYLQELLRKEEFEIPYDTLKYEVCKRIINDGLISSDQEVEFKQLFELADFRAESTVQYLNQSVVDTLKYFKANGGKVYLVSDFYGSKSLFEKLLNHHGILDVFDGIFSSSDLEKSKHRGTIYPDILTTLGVDASETMMIGDNARSDCENAKKHSLNAYCLPHKKHLRRNKRNNVGNDQKKLNRIVNKIYRACKKRNAIPYTEYIVFYHTFAERLYYLAKREKIKDLFFLSREGKYLKKLFDSYQQYAIIDDSKKINTHYLKISRHASFQFSFRDINEERFYFLNRVYPDLSVNDFLQTINCPEELRSAIFKEIGVDGTSPVKGFFTSSTFKKLKANEKFLNYYNTNRTNSRKAFKAYVESFNADIENDGITIVDIGWGGTMQESIFKFFEKRIEVTGYYLGLSEIYNIEPKSKRKGLNFSIMPFLDYDDRIIMANMQLYEQFSAADHGSAYAYSLENDGFVLDYFKPEEKWLYENHIKQHQEQMFGLHKELLKKLEPICYERDMMQNALSELALKVGLFQNNKKLKFLDTLSHGFYQNVATNQVGISYKPPKIKSPAKSVINFLMTPEKYFRYLVKLKPAIYNKNKVLAFLTPMFLIYFYYKLNKFIRFKFLDRFFLLKFNVFNK